jgi:large repetitive protein
MRTFRVLPCLAAVALLGCNCHKAPPTNYSVTFTQPTAGQTLPTGPFTVVASSTGFSSGSTASLTVGAAAPLSATMAADGSFTFPQVSFTGPATVALVIVATDSSTGTTAQDGISVTVSGPLGAGPTCAITFPSGTADAGAIVLNALGNYNPTPPGFETPIVISVAGAASGTAWVCSDSASLSSAPACAHGGHKLSNAQGTDQAFTAAGSLTFSNVAIPEGPQNLTCEAKNTAGAQGAASPALAVNVETTTPHIVLTNTDYSGTDHCPADGGTPPCYLNATDIPTGTAHFNLAITGSVNTSTAPSLLVNTQNLGTCTTVSGSGIATCSATVTPNGIKDIQATVTDIWGNPNVHAVNPTITDPKSSLSVNVETTPPSVAFTAPANNAQLGPSSGLPLVGGGTALQLTLAVTASAASPDTLEGTVVFSSTSANAPALGPATVTNGAAQLSDATLTAFPQGNYTVTASLTDVAGNMSTANVTFTVNLTPPTISFVSPTSGQTFTSTSTIPLTISTNAPSTIAGSQNNITVTTSISGVPSSQIPVPTTGNATGSILVPNGTQTLTASVQNAAGVAGQATVGITVNFSGCSLVMSSPNTTVVTYNAASDLVPGTPGIQVDITGVSSNCPGKTVTLSRSGTSVGTQVTGSSGNFQFTDYTFNDGDTNIPMTVSISDGAVPTPNITIFSFSVTAKSTLPSFTSATPAFGAITIVAPTGNPTVNGTNILASQNSSLGVINLTFTIAAGAITGFATAGSLSVTQGTTTLASQPITTAPQTIGPLPISLPEGVSTPVSVTATDPVGNVVTQSYPVTVDVIPPAAPTVTPTLTDSRASTVKLAWTDPAGTVTHDIRYATSTVLPNGIPDDATFFGSSTVIGTNPPAGQPGQPISYNLTSVPALNRYFIAVRAVDAVGNRSALNNVVTLDNCWTNGTYANGTCSTTNTEVDTVATGSFAFNVKSGDFDGDGTSDIAVSDRLATTNGNSYGGMVTVYFGNEATHTPLATSQQICSTSQSPCTSQASELFGAHIEVVDANCDGVPDLLVGANGYSSSRGRAFLYFGAGGGVPGTQFNTANAIEFRGTLGTAGGFGRAIRATGNVFNPGGACTTSFEITAPSEGNGMVYLFKARTNWSSLLSTEGASQVVETSSADMAVAGTNAGDMFGFRYGAAGLGNLDGSGYDSLFLSASVENVSKAYAFIGKAIATGTSPIAAASATQVIQGATEAATAYQAGFGYTSVGGLTYSGGATPDVVISDPTTAQVSLYQTSAAGLASSPLQTLSPPTPPAYFGYSLVGADVNGDGSNDLVIGSYATTSMPAAFIYLNTGSTTAPLSLGSRLGGNTSFGTSVTVGDFNGDGHPDIAIGAPYDGNGHLYLFY